MIGISSHELARLNKSAESAAKYSAELGGGYMASLEVFHQLHCLVRPGLTRRLYSHDQLTFT